MLNIAIDGPAGAGKSTIAKIVSKRLGILYLDTGAMYRSVALKALKEGIDTKDRLSLVKVADCIDICIKYRDNEQRIYLDKEDVSECIRTPEVSRAASDVAVVPEVRLKMVEIQRGIAAGNEVVMDGRDIGTYVLPNASLKIFLTASIEERAMRRYNEQKAKGITDIDLEEVKKDIELRDKNDSSRAFAPLSKAEDAVQIDTTKMTIEEVADKIISLVKRKI
ncbi:MAG: (d)CMP kinase [Bacillota bacterium]|nr:(d)CMP kinase [Bacillota bacterium]